jgi:hypothetical protein
VTFLEAYVMFGIPLMILALGGAALVYTRWEDRRERERHTPGE